MKHYQYYVINAPIDQEESSSSASFNKMIVHNKFDKKDLVDVLHLTNDAIIDIYIFGYTINQKLYSEFNSDLRVEDLCVEIDKAVYQTMDRNSIKLNIVYISQLRTNENDNAMERLSAARVQDIICHVPPHYASITKIFLEDSPQDLLGSYFSSVYRISEPLTQEVLIDLIIQQDAARVIGLYPSPRLEELDKLPAYLKKEHEQAGK